MPKVTVIIPAYNPATPFVELVKGLVADFDVLVVNDGSKEECLPMFDAAVAAGARLLTHEVNRGKGAALKTAIAHAKHRRGMVCRYCRCRRSTLYKRHKDRGGTYRGFT